jgi:hypothetical protein
LKSVPEILLKKVEKLEQFIKYVKGNNENSNPNRVISESKAGENSKTTIIMSENDFLDMSYLPVYLKKVFKC